MSQRRKEKNRLFELIKQRQNCFNETSTFQNKNTCSLSSIDKNDVYLVSGADRKNYLASHNENSIDLDPVNTSTFGYGVNYNQRRNNIIQSVDQSHDLDNENGMMSTSTSKMNKRYITNQLMESDSSIEDQIVNDLHEEISSKASHPKIISKLSVSSLKQSKSTSSKDNKSSNDSENKYIEINDDERIVNLDDEHKHINDFRNELLFRIINRYSKNSEIFLLKSGYIAFIKNCILIKKALNLLQVIQKLFIKKQYENEIDFIQSLKEKTMISKGTDILRRCIKRKVFLRLKEDNKIKSDFSKGFMLLRSFFLNQPLCREFIENINRINLNQSSTSLIVPLQNKSIFVDVETKSNIKKGIKILASTISFSNLRLKRMCFTELLNSLNESKCETISSIEEQPTETTIEAEEVNILKPMKLLIIFENSKLKQTRKAWQQWRKYQQIRKDLLTVSQLNMYKVMQRILSKFELSSMGKKFYHWKYTAKYSIDNIEIEHSNQDIQTEDVVIKEIIQSEDQKIQTEEIRNIVETCSVEINTSSPETVEIQIETDPPNLVHDQEIQTDNAIEDTFKTPEDERKRNKSEGSDIKQSDTSNRRSLTNFPLQIKKMENIAKPLKLDNEFAELREVKEIKPKINKEIVVTPINDVSIITPSTARQEYSKFQEKLLESCNNQKENDEDDLEEIRFSIHGDSSLDEHSEDGKNNHVVKKQLSSNIRVPQFKMSKTYDKRASSHNFRYI